MWAALLGAGGASSPVAGPRLSTTYDADGHQRRAGPRAVGRPARTTYPRRGAGEVVCAARRCDSGALRLDCAFLRWHAGRPRRRRPLRRPAPRVSAIRAARLGLRRRPHRALLAAFAGDSGHPGIRPAGFRPRPWPTPRRTTGANPLYALERGEHERGEFLAALEGALAPSLGRRVDARTASASADGRRCDPNDAAVRLLPRAARGARRYGWRILTNNVREWEPMWRAKLPIDEIFDDVVDSGVRRHAQARARDLRAGARSARAAGRGVRVRRRPRAQRRRGARRSACRRALPSTPPQTIAELEALIR